MGEKFIADVLDGSKARYCESFGAFEPQQKAVVFLDDRWVAIEGSYTPEEISDAVEHIEHRRLTKELGKDLADLSPFAIKDGEVFIKDAFIGNGITSANWSMKVNADENGHRYAAGMGVAVEDGKEQVAFKAERFSVTAAAQNIIENAQAMTSARITAAELKTRLCLSDDMREAVIDAIRESDVFKALLVSQDAQASSLVTTQQAIEQAANDAIRNALKPGGLLYRP